MQEVSVRAARAGDGAALARLWVEAGEHHVRLDPEHHRRPDVDGLDEWCEASIEAVARQGGVTFVAELDGAVVGFVNASLREPRADAAKQIQRDQGIRRAWVGAIAVLESQRQRGAGRALLRAVEEWARRQGAAAVQLDVLRSNQPAMALYQGSGFAETAVVMEKRLD